MRKHAPAESVDDGGEIDEAARHWDVGYVHALRWLLQQATPAGASSQLRPDVIGPDDLRLAQQIRVDLVPRHRLARVRLAINRFDSHALHQRSDMPAADFNAVCIQKIPQYPAARERKVEMQFVHSAHDGEIGGGRRPRRIIDAASADVQRLRLLGDRQCMGTVDHRFALSRPALLSAPFKKA